MNYLKHSKSKYLLLAVIALLLYQCSKEEKVAKSVVQVNNAVLTEEDLNNALSEKANKGKYREEYIQSWIETEVLYQEAVKKGILDEKEYKSIIEQSRKQLAASMFLDKELAEKGVTPTNDELLKYFAEYKDDFRLEDNAFKINIAYFNNFDKAVRFRSILLESGWRKSINAFHGDQSLVRESNGTIIYTSRLFPVSLYQTVNNMEPNEISIVLETEPSRFAVVQLLDKLPKGTIPPFEAVLDRVKDQYMVLKHKEFVRNFIDKLIEDHNVEIKRYNE